MHVGQRVGCEADSGGPGRPKAVQELVANGCARTTVGQGVADGPWFRHLSSRESASLQSRQGETSQRPALS